MPERPIDLHDHPQQKPMHGRSLMPLSTTEIVLGEVAAERVRQESKWGQQNHDDHPADAAPTTSVEGFAYMAEMWKRRNTERVDVLNDAGAAQDRNCYWDGILLEEVFEALAEVDPLRIRGELVQVAAVAVAWIESIDRRLAVAIRGALSSDPAQPSSGALGVSDPASGTNGVGSATVALPLDADRASGAERPELVLVRGTVYRRQWSGRGLKYVYLRVSVPPDARPGKRPPVPARYPEDRLPEHEVITAERAQEIISASVDQWRELNRQGAQDAR